MASHSNATARQETPCVTKSTKNVTSSIGRSRKQGQEAGQNKPLNLGDRSQDSNSTAKPTSGRPKNTSITRSTNGPTKTTISNALKRRAKSLLKNKSVDAQSRVVIRYALETNDPWLADLVRRTDAGEPIIDEAGFLRTT